MSHVRNLILGGLGVALAAGMAIAQGGAHDSAIAARKGQMQLYAFNLGTLGAMAKGDMAYDSEAASAAAGNIAAIAKLSAAAMWPQGSDSDSAEKTRALPAIWTSFPDVGAKAGALSEAADAMVAAAGQDLASLQAAMKPLGGACGACHKAYRQPE